MAAPSERQVSLADIDAAVAQAREARSHAIAALLLAVPALFPRLTAAARGGARHPAAYRGVRT